LVPVFGIGAGPAIRKLLGSVPVLRFAIHPAYEVSKPTVLAMQCEVYFDLANGKSDVGRIANRRTGTNPQPHKSQIAGPAQFPRPANRKSQDRHQPQDPQIANRRTGTNSQDPQIANRRTGTNPQDPQIANRRTGTKIQQMQKPPNCNRRTGAKSNCAELKIAGPAPNPILPNRKSQDRHLSSKGRKKVRNANELWRRI
jgi:hypothetical protein